MYIVVFRLFYTKKQVLATIAMRKQPKEIHLYGLVENGAVDFSQKSQKMQLMLVRICVKIVKNVMTVVIHGVHSAFGTEKELKQWKTEIGKAGCICCLLWYF